MMGFMKPAPHVARLPADRIDAEYKRLRMQVFWGTFLGYATYYLLRKNFSLAMPYIVEESGYTRRNWASCSPCCPSPTASASS